MKVGDIVKILDESFCLCMEGGKQPYHLSGVLLTHRRWKIVGQKLQLPVYACGASDGELNDLLLCDADDPSCLLFTRARYCEVIQIPESGLTLAVPSGARRITITFA